MAKDRRRCGELLLHHWADLNYREAITERSVRYIKTRIQTYELDDNNRIQTAIDYSWNTSSESWIESNEKLNYSYDRNGNIERIEFLTANGGVEGFITFEHQYIGQVIENESLTFGIEPYR